MVERDERGEPTGVLREESCWTFRDRHVEISDGDYVEAMRVGVKLADSRGVVAVHDKDGWLGALRFWQALRERETLTLRVWQSLPHEKVDELESVDVQSGLGDEFLRVGYLKAFMDGTLGSQTARLLDGSGVQITSREELEEIVRRGALAGFPVAVHAISDLANREALDAFEATQDVWRPLGLRHRIEHAQLLADEDVSRFAQLGVAASVQFTRRLRPRPRRPLLGRRVAPRLSLARALGRRHARRERLGRADRRLDPWAGVAAGVRKTWDDRGRGTRRRPSLSTRRCSQRASTRPFFLAMSVTAGGSSPAWRPTSSCSTATRTRSSPTHFPTCRSSPRWSTAGGFTIRPRGERSVKANETGDVFSFLVYGRAHGHQYPDRRVDARACPRPLNRQSLGVRWCCDEPLSRAPRHAHAALPMPVRSVDVRHVWRSGAEWHVETGSPATKARTR